MMAPEYDPELAPNATAATYFALSDRARRASGQNLQYAVRYDDHIVADPSWHSVADVIATYHGGFADEQGRVTGVLLRRVGDDWEEVA